MGLPKSVRFTVRKLVFAAALQRIPTEGQRSLGMEEVSLKVTASASTSATTACSIFGQDSQNKTGYDPSGKEPISFFFPGSPGKACLEHYGGDTQAEAKPSHTKVWNKMLIKGLKRGEDKENMLTPV